MLEYVGLNLVRGGRVGRFSATAEVGFELEADASADGGEEFCECVRQEYNRKDIAHPARDDGEFLATILDLVYIAVFLA